MKVDRNGRSAVLTHRQLDALLAAAPAPRYRALWAIQRWTAARISETLSLRWGDVIGGAVTYRKATTKGKATRQVVMAPQLASILDAYKQAWTEEQGHPPAKQDVLFPGRDSTRTPMTRQAADRTLRLTCEQLGLEGVSTHSFRRSFATGALKRGVDLPTIQQVTGHRSLGSLGPYLDVEASAVLAAVVGA